MKLKLTLNKRFLVFIIIFTALNFIYFSYEFWNKKGELRESFYEQIEKKVDLLINELQEKILITNSENIRNILQTSLNTLSLNSVKLQYKNNIFSKENLIKNSNYPKNQEWELSEVTSDARNGYIVLLANNIYRFNNTTFANLDEPISFKFLLYKNQTVVNAFSSLQFRYFLQNLDVEINNESYVFKKEIYFMDEPLADFEYTINEAILIKQIKILQKEYLINTFYVSFIGLIFSFLLYFLIIKKFLLNPINEFKNSMKDALENDFMQNLDEKKGNNPDIDQAFDLLNKILRKYIGVVNELNINKGILERKVFTDDLTGLPNQKVFELDLKNMFIVGSDGFIGSIKLEALGGFTKEFGAALANHLIEEFTHVVQNKFYETNLQEASLYRFFGSEFAIILKNEEESKVIEFSRFLFEELQELQTRYEVKSTLCNFSFVPFDKYGTIDSILHALSDAYNISKEKKEHYHIVSPAEVLNKFQFLEQEVREIIEKNSFEITFGFNTYSTEDDKKLIMKEAMPVLYDKNREKFSIGVFISIAEKINLAAQFDKHIIEEVVKYIKSNELEYSIAINLSMLSLKDSEFVNWLHSLFLYNKNISQYMVFSMTSYNASTNIEIFKNFIDEIHRFGSKIILKRFNSNDFTVEQLEELNLDYLRISKDYTTNIAKDRDKKHFLRTIVNFGQSHDIMIIGDSIKDQKDIEICTTIGLDAISNF